MSHPLYKILRVVEEEKLWFRIDRYRDDTVMITITVVGERLEIDVFEDGHIEFSRFKGNEDVESDGQALDKLLRQHGLDQTGVDPA